MAVVVLRNGLPVGTVSLKQQDDPDFAAISKESPWLGSLQVIYEERNQGIGQELFEVAKAFAVHLGYKNIFLYTSNIENLDWYNKRGACPIETRPFRNHVITIMKVPLIDSGK